MLYPLCGVWRGQARPYNYSFPWILLFVVFYERPLLHRTTSTNDHYLLDIFYCCTGLEILFFCFFLICCFMFNTYLLIKIKTSILQSIYDLIFQTMPQQPRVTCTTALLHTCTTALAIIKPYRFFCCG